MVTGYVILKFAHVFIAIVALGTSAGLGIVLEFYGNHPTHGPFVLRMIYRLVALVVMPGYVLMLVTGGSLVDLSWSFSMKWIQAALGLWVVGALFLGASLAVLQRQVRLFDTSGPSSDAYRQISLLGRVLGAGTGLVVMAILYLMVLKPSGFLSS
jgi:uncharacterized membrane protein